MNKANDQASLEKAGPQLSLEEVRAQIVDAIVNHQLLPKTKLGEEKLAQALKVSRARIREALARLEVEHMVVSIPNRGTFVAAPSISEARQILHARRVIESETVRMLARSATRTQIKELTRCVAAEREAWKSGDRQRAIALSREFHSLIAEMSGNAILADLLRQVVARMSLAIALYDRAHKPDCMFDEHVDLLDAISKHDEDRATQIALGHLDHMEEALDSIPDEEAEPDLASIFGTQE